MFKWDLGTCSGLNISYDISIPEEDISHSIPATVLTVANRLRERIIMPRHHGIKGEAMFRFETPRHTPITTEPRSRMNRRRIGRTAGGTVDSYIGDRSGVYLWLLRHFFGLGRGPSVQFRTEACHRTRVQRWSAIAQDRSNDCGRKEDSSHFSVKGPNVQRGKAG